MKELFLLSGLGADRRVFDFLDLSAYRITHIEWIAPLPDEAIEQYAGRLLGQIKHPEPILIGVSFGGMMAVEIGKLIPTEQIILISSARTRSEIPASFRWMGKLKVHHLIPDTFLNAPNAMLHTLFGVSKSWEKELLDQIIRETDPEFLRWALDRIISWNNKTLLPNTTCIHGSKDKLFPYAKATHTIPGAGHFMVVNRAQEVSACIHAALNRTAN